MKPKIIFAGTTEFGLPALEMLRQNFDLVAIITQPDKPAGKKQVITPPPVKDWALKNNIPVMQPVKIADAAADIKNLEPAVMVVAAYGQIIPKNILELPKRGSINLHGSILPKYRGASPIQTAILNDEKETGVTIMQMDEKMDHGPIISSITVPINNTDDYSSLHQKLADAGAKILAETLPKWLDGSIVGQAQIHQEATFAKLLKRDDGRIDWTTPARQIFQQIKALNPEPGTWTTLDKKSVKILKAEELRNGRIDLPGKIYADGKDCLVKCGDYSLKLLMVQPEGKKPMTGHDFINGLKKLETKVFV
jgi:methionyl-tRNA formyltransferase